MKALPVSVQMASATAVWLRKLLEAGAVQNDALSAAMVTHVRNMHKDLAAGDAGIEADLNKIFDEAQAETTAILQGQGTLASP